MQILQEQKSAFVQTLPWAVFVNLLSVQVPDVIRCAQREGTAEVFLEF